MKTTTAFPPARTPLAVLRTVPGWAWAILGAVIVYAVITQLILSAYQNPQVRFRIDIAPFISASLAVQVHVVAAVSTFCIGVVLLAAPKGFRLHKTLGWSWVIAMFVTAVSSFFITGIMGSSFSPIHALSAWTLIGLPFGVAAARRRDIKKHRSQMTGMFLGAMVIAGLFTFLPGRLMWNIFFAV